MREKNNLTAVSRKGSPEEREREKEIERESMYKTYQL